MVKVPEPVYNVVTSGARVWRNDEQIFFFVDTLSLDRLVALRKVRGLSWRGWSVFLRISIWRFSEESELSNRCMTMEKVGYQEVGGGS